MRGRSRVAWSHVLGQRGAQENHATRLSTWAGPSCSLRLLTPHSRCSANFHLPGPARPCPARQPAQPLSLFQQSGRSANITRCQETAILAISDCPPPWPLAPCCHPPALSRYHALAQSVVRRSMLPWPASRAPTPASEALGPAHHAISGRTSHHRSHQP